METGNGDQDLDAQFEIEKNNGTRLQQDFKDEIQAVINSVKSLTLTVGCKLGSQGGLEIINKTLARRKKTTSTETVSINTLSSISPITPHDGHQNVEDVCHRVWRKFSNKHQKSPSHINNNVQSCPKSIDAARLNRKSATQPIAGLQHDTGHGSKRNNGLWTKSEKDKKNTGWVLLTDSFQRMVRVSTILFKTAGMIAIVMIFLYSLITLHKPTQAFISRHTQDFIYPFMRALRILSLPVVRRLPILTDLYEEPCLLSNPFYTIDDLDCWPCESVRHVIDLTGFSNFSSAYHHSGIPFILKDAFKTDLAIEDIRTIYSENKDLLGKAFVESNRLGLTTVEKLFSQKNRELFEADDFHVEWNINRVTTARLWRRYFPKPYFVPETTEVSVQHFMFIDQVSALPYRLPLTEFANVFLTQTSGSRSIVLIPTQSCHSQCKVVSAVLQPKDVLFYNWLFWRPISVPADSSTLRTMAITYVGSFY